MRRAALALLALALPGAAGATMTIVPVDVQDAQSGMWYEASFDADGGDPATRHWWSEDLPEWLTLSQSRGGATVRGIAGGVGAWIFPLHVDDDRGNSAFIQVGLQVLALQSDCGPPPDAVVGVPYQFQLTNWLTGPLTFQLVAGNLPPGIVLSSDGLLSGTAPGGTPAASYTAVVDVRDDGNHVSRCAFALSVLPPSRSTPADDARGPGSQVPPGGCSTSDAAPGLLGLLALRRRPFFRQRLR